MWYKCITCKKTIPKKDLKTCMSGGMLYYVCSSECMYKFYGYGVENSKIITKGGE